MGLGIAAMHYSGMGAIRIVPFITYEPKLLILSIVIAIVASFAALWLFFRLRGGASWRILLQRSIASLVMGAAISGMHYTGMFASRIRARLLLHRRDRYQQRLARVAHRRLRA